MISRLEVDAATYLRQNDYNMTILGELDAEFRVVVVRRPWNVQTCPLLCDTPLRAEETGPVEHLVFAQEIFIRYPEHL